MGISEDQDHWNHPRKQRAGYRQPTKEEELKGEGPFGPYHEPKGNDIEKALLQFLLDTGIDVHSRLVDRNRNEDVICYIPFSNKDKIKITARVVSDPAEWADQNTPEVYIVV